MADYYPLIARAVAGLEKNTGDARRAVYERARTALVAQLRSVNPPLSENDVTRERLALEESIRKVEAEAARKSWVDPGHAAAQTGATQARVRAPEFPRWDTPPPAAPEEDFARQPRADSMNGRQGTARAVNPPVQARAAPPPQNGMPGDRAFEQAFDQPLPPPDQGPAMSMRPVARAKPERRPMLEPGQKNLRETIADHDEDTDPLPRVVRSGPARDNGSMPPPASHDFDRIDTRSFDPRGAPMSDYPGQPMLEPGPDYDDARPPRGRQGAAMERASRRSFGDIVRVALTLFVLAGLGAVLVWQWPNMAALYRSARAPSPPTMVTNDSQPTTTRSVKNTERFEPSGPAATPQAQPTLAAVPTGPAVSGAAVAQKVVLYEEDPTDPNGRRFVGSAIWRTERVSPGPNQPEEIAIRADVEIPDRRLTMTWSLRRNTDQSLPATHTVEIMFRLPQDFPPGAVTNVPGILMKQTEQTRGAPLAGHAVKVTDSYYLIGLSSIDADRENNLRMLKERGWFDIPVVYSNKRRAILAVEKGTPGERAFAEAFAAWRQ
jgi:hypothetical protein